MTTLDTSQPSDAQRRSTTTGELPADSWLVITDPRSWNVMHSSSSDPELSALLDGSECDLDSILSRIQARLADEARSTLPMALVKLVRDESADPDARSMALEALASARIAELEDKVVAAIVAGLNSKSADVVFTAVSCLPTLPPGRRASFKLEVRALTERSGDADVRRAASAFLRSR